MKGFEVKNLSFSYEKSSHGKEILSGINLSGSNGESIGIIGANGVGKSTLLKLLVGLHLDYNGEINVFQTPVKKETLPRVRKKMGYVFQDSDSHLFMSTVYEDVAFAPRNYGYSEEQVEKMVLSALKSVLIEHLKHSSIYKLSGGEKKLVSIATILSLQPDLILLDEPSVGLDPKNRRNLINVLNQLEMMKVIASHDLDLILDTCSRTILLCDGKIAADGKTQELLKNKELLEKYGLELPLSYSRTSRIS